MMRRAFWMFFYVLVVQGAWGNSASNDTLIIGKETVYLEEQSVHSGDVNFWLKYSEDYRKMPRTIRWGVQAEAGGMLLKNAWDNSKMGTPLSQLNPNRRHWRFSPAIGLSGYAMWNETIGIGAGFKYKSWARDVERLPQSNAEGESPFGYLYNDAGFFQIDVVDVDSSGFFELDTTKIATQTESFKVKIQQFPIYFVFAYEQPRSLWSYQGMLGGVYTQYSMHEGSGSFLNDDLTQLSTHHWSSVKQSSWSMFMRTTVNRSLKGNCKTFVAMSAAWPFYQWESKMGDVRINPIDLTFGISWEY